MCLFAHLSIFYTDALLPFFLSDKAFALLPIAAVPFKLFFTRTFSPHSFRNYGSQKCHAENQKDFTMLQEREKEAFIENCTCLLSKHGETEC